MAEPDPYLLAITEPDRDDVRRLISSSDAYLASLYPAESNHLTDIAALVSKEHLSRRALRGRSRRLWRTGPHPAGRM
jgi:putative acetyltransferase